MKLKIIITGATGMVGKGGLLTCIGHPDVEGVPLISRKPCGRTHPKLREVIHADFPDISTLSLDFNAYPACFFCLGVSSIGMKEAAYRNQTYELAMHMGKTMAAQNPELTCCYVSGAGTDSCEKENRMWARIKGRRENDLMKLFKKAYMFRPALIRFYKDQKSLRKIYRLVNIFYPAFKLLFPSYLCTIREIGLAMIRVTQYGYPRHLLEIKDVRELSKEKTDE